MIDKKLSIRMRLVIAQAGEAGTPAVFVMVKGSEYRFFSIGDKSDFKAEITKSHKDGFEMLGVIVLSFTDDGQPLIEDEMMGTADPKQVQAARQLFVETLIAKGILKPGTATA